MPVSKSGDALNLGNREWVPLLLSKVNVIYCQTAKTVHGIVLFQQM